MSTSPTTEDLHVAFSVSAKTLIDLYDPNQGRTVHGTETIDSLRSRYPDVEVTPSWDDAQSLIENEYVRAPQRIDRQKWLEAFDSRHDLVRRGRTETFKASEPVFGNIAIIYARDEWRFFKLYDRADTTHEQIMAKCRASDAAGNGSLTQL